MAIMLIRGFPAAVAFMVFPPTPVPSVHAMSKKMHAYKKGKE